jgi:putative oxidoreductase
VTLNPDLFILIARILIGGAFVFSATGMARNFGFVRQFLTSKGIPFPVFVGIFGIIIELTLGAMMILDLYVPWVALALAAFVVAATLMCHDFWRMGGPERMAEINHVVSNTIIVGALIGFAAALL